MSAATPSPTVVPELSTGRRPQNAILCRGVARPDLIYNANDLEKMGDRAWSIPEHVPVFTTESAMKAFMDPPAGSKRGRDDGDANLIPVVAHMGVDGGAEIAEPDGKFIFVGISYGEASRARPTVRLSRKLPIVRMLTLPPGLDCNGRPHANGSKPQKGARGRKTRLVGQQCIRIRSWNNPHFNRRPDKR